MARGGKRPGSGRPSRADEIKVAEQIRNVISDDEIVKNLVDIARSGEKDSDRIKANELLAAYLWGKPNQTIQQKIEITDPIRPEWFDE